MTQFSLSSSSDDSRLPSNENQLQLDSDLAPVFWHSKSLTKDSFRVRFQEAMEAWLVRSPSLDTRTNYARDVQQFLDFLKINPDEVEQLSQVRPSDIATWRDALGERGLQPASIRRKLTALRSLFSYLQTYGYTGANPAHGDFVAAPPVSRDGKTVGLAPEDCRRLLDFPSPTTPLGLRNRALLSVLAYTGCRVGELTRLRVDSYKTSSGHRLLEILGKGGKERRVPLHPEAFERLDAWLHHSGLHSDPTGPLFRPPLTSRGHGQHGFARRFLARRSVQRLISHLVHRLHLDPSVSVHSFRVTALTTARERGCDILDLQDFAGHSDPRTTLTYIRNRDRLSRSPAYALRY